MIEDVDYTASGYIQAIAPDGTVISRHRQEREAQQACFQHAKDNEDLLGDGVHDYILRSPDVRMSIRLLSVGGNPTNEDTTPPDPPAGVFNNSVTSTGFTTNWTNGPESDLQEHRVYRSSTGPGSGFSLVDTVTVPTASYSHTGLTAETQYWVYVTALDSSGNESVASSVVNSTTSAATSDPYDLYATDSQSRGTIPFTVTWPTAPTITSEATVTNNSELQASLAINGRRTIVAPGTYGSLGTISGTDKEIVFQSGASVSVGAGTFSGEITGQRIKISGGTFTAGFRPRGDFGASDVLFDGITVNQEDGWNGFDIWAPNKFAFINGTYDMTGYSFLVITPGSDFIFANNNHVCKTTAQGGRAPIRVQAPTRYVFVDNRIVNEEGNTYHTLRTHSDNTDVWFRNNQFEGPTGGRGVELQNDILEGPASSTRLYFYDNNSYNANGQGYTLDTGDGPITNVYADGNTVYNTTGSGQAFGSGTGWVIGNNPILPYQSPPIWVPN